MPSMRLISYGVINPVWGIVPPGDAEENLRSVENGWRILSSYVISEDQNLWIITEADRSVTTLLLPEEY